MALKDYYEKLGQRSTPRKEFRSRVATECGVAEMTVFRWISGEVIPDKLKQEKIAEIAGVPSDLLFPQQKEVENETV